MAVEIIVEVDVTVKMVVVVEVMTTVTNHFVLTVGDIDILRKLAGTCMVGQDMYVQHQWRWTTTVIRMNMRQVSRSTHRIGRMSLQFSVKDWLH